MCTTFCWESSAEQIHVDISRLRLLPLYVLDEGHLLLFRAPNLPSGTLPLVIFPKQTLIMGNAGKVSDPGCPPRVVYVTLGHRREVDLCKIVLDVKDPRQKKMAISGTNMWFIHVFFRNLFGWPGFQVRVRRMHYILNKETWSIVCSNPSSLLTSTPSLSTSSGPLHPEIWKAELNRWPFALMSGCFAQHQEFFHFIST